MAALRWHGIVQLQHKGHIHFISARQVKAFGQDTAQRK
jgi:hypothetical protein